MYLGVCCLFYLDCGNSLTLTCIVTCDLILADVHNQYLNGLIRIESVAQRQIQNRHVLGFDSLYEALRKYYLDSRWLQGHAREAHQRSLH